MTGFSVLYGFLSRTSWRNQTRCISTLKRFQILTFLIFNGSYIGRCWQEASERHCSQQQVLRAKCMLAAVLISLFKWDAALRQYPFLEQTFLHSIVCFDLSSFFEIPMTVLVDLKAAFSFHRVHLKDKLKRKSHVQISTSDLNELETTRKPLSLSGILCLVV